MSENFSAQLRAATWSDHGTAEQSTFLDDLTKGALTVTAHTALTVQHYLIYEVLEEAAEAQRSHPVAGRFHTDTLARRPALAADLAQLLGAEWRDALIANPATAEYRARLKEVAFTWPAGFVAHHYNRYLGDLSGGQYVARAIAEAYGLTVGAPGLLFYRFDELGDHAAFKSRYRAELDAAGWDAGERDLIIEEVRTAYRLNVAVLAELGRELAGSPFSPAVVRQIMAHMNGDHADDCVLICRAQGGQPSTSQAVMSGMDSRGIDFLATVNGAPMPLRVPFAQPLTERVQVRVEVTRLYHEARKLLGLPELTQSH